MTDEKKPTPEELGEGHLSIPLTGRYGHFPSHPEELAKQLVADGIANKNHNTILTEVETRIANLLAKTNEATDYLVAIVSELLDHIADLDDQVESTEYDRDQLEKEIREAKDNRAEQLYLKADINDPNDPHWTNYLKEVSND